MHRYRRATPKQLLASTSLPPHLYAVAERAVRHAYSPSEDGASAERPKDQVNAAVHVVETIDYHGLSMVSCVHLPCSSSPAIIHDGESSFIPS